MKLGLTGGVASGKSTVSALLVESGAVLIDADQLAREVVQPGTAGLAAVVGEFGSEVLASDGSLDRAKLGSIVFADETRRKKLESIIHPLVFERMRELESAAGPDDLVVHDIPLLAENRRQDDFDAVLVVDAPDQVRVDRMVRDRGWTEAEAWARIGAQANREDRLAIATYVVENTGTIEDLRERVAEVLEIIRKGS